MYSIYDHYGMTNDLQDRYAAAKNAGSGQVTSSGVLRGTLDNAPFLPKTSSGVTSTHYVPSDRQQLSLYDYQGESGSYSPTGSAYSEGELANYPSPSWMEPVANTMFNVGTSIADMAVPGLGFVAQQGRAYSMDPTNYSLGRNLTSGALNYGLNYGVNRSGLMGELTKGVSTGNQYSDFATGQMVKGGVHSLISNFVDFIIGKAFGPAPSRGHNNMAGFDDDTYGYSSTAQTPAQIAAQHNISLGSLMASSPFGGASYANEYAPGGLMNPDTNAYPNTGGIATGPNESGGDSSVGGGSGIGSGGPGGGYTGDAWGDLL